MDVRFKVALNRKRKIDQKKNNKNLKRSYKIIKNNFKPSNYRNMIKESYN